MIDGLMWEKETQEEMDGYDAMEYAKNLRLGGYDDWRLPTVEEFGGIVTLCGGELAWFDDDDDDDCSEKTDRNRKNKTYHEAYKKLGFAFNYYWSSTTFADGEYYAWGVFFYNGLVYYYSKSNNRSVRCVRDGQ